MGSSRDKSFVLFWDVVGSCWMSCSPSVHDPVGRHVGKGKREMLFRAKKYSSYVLFLSCGRCAAQGLDEVFDLCV